MAIIACKECAREVSDKAACCPHCGVSIAAGVRRKPRRVKAWFYGTLILGLLAWGALATLWLTGTIPMPKELVGFIGTGSGPAEAPEKKIERVSLVAPAPSALESKQINSAVYRTSAEQLYQDYDANEVAIQSKIGDSPIRVSGSVAEIDEDASGHPVVTLHAGSGNRADMLLADHQRSAAAQLSKADAVEIQCNKMQRIAARLHGSGCALVLVDAGTVYLAVSLSGKAGNSPLYIVGPMSRKTCVASSDSIAVQVTSNPRSERILTKSCAATARESVSLEGCHLSSTMPAIPDIPTAHLWKYDCMAPAAETRRAAETATSRGTRNRAAAPVVTAAIASSPQPTSATAVAPSGSDAPAPKAPQEAASSAAAANLPEPAAIRTVAVVPPAPVLENNPAPAGGAASATVNAGDAGSPPPATPAAAPSSTSTAPTLAVAPSPTSAAPTLAVAPSPTSTAPTPPAAVADDLVPVRTKDPEAADRIVSYCNRITSGATNPTTVAARCRRDEMDAWTRLIVQNEFPTLDETSRRKCKEPPFPDSFVARESCAKYQLHLD
jgi:tRNA_anti-like